MKNITAAIAAASAAAVILVSGMMPTAVSAAQIGTLSSGLNGISVDDTQSSSYVDDDDYMNESYINDDYMNISYVSEDDNMTGYNSDEDDFVTTAYSGDSYTGTYVCGRAAIYVKKDNQFYDVTIDWGNSAFETTEWTYVCCYDQASGSLIADGTGSKAVIGYDEDGSELYRNTEYTDGSAQFMLVGDSLIWEDMEEYAGQQMIFECIS